MTRRDALGLAAVSAVCGLAMLAIAINTGAPGLYVLAAILLLLAVVAVFL